ncbi:hypothetical protein JW948_03740 [bacterium]|nr:hypothetical protein [bacterium]
MTLKKWMIVPFIIMCTAAAAQSPFQASANLEVGIPQNEFSDNLDATGFGGGLSFLYELPMTPLSIGAGFDFLIYGSETRREPWSQTIPDVTVEVSRTNSIIQGFLMMRIQPPIGAVRPYFDGLLGFNYFSTSTSVKSEWSDEEIASSTNYDDGTSCMGFGGGLLFRVYEKEAKPEIPNDRDVTVFIDAGFRYLNGGEARYLKKGDIEINEANKVVYHPHESTTDLVVIKLGATVAF